MVHEEEGVASTQTVEKKKIIHGLGDIGTTSFIGMKTLNNLRDDAMTVAKIGHLSGGPVDSKKPATVKKPPVIVIDLTGGAHMSLLDYGVTIMSNKVALVIIIPYIIATVA